MIVLISGLLVLWLVLARSPYWRRLGPEAAARLMKRGGAGLLLFAAVVVLLKGHAELALLLVGGALWLFNLANKAASPAIDTAAGPARVSRVRSAMIEMELDKTSGAMRGLVLAGPSEGRRLDQMSRPECEAVYRLCREADREGARLLEAYFDRRFAGWRQAGQADRDAWRDRARHPNRMSEDEAYEVLGLPRGAARDEVVRSHRTLMKKLHPDQGGSTDLAARVNEAKEVLMRRHG
jgi:hypothetical protein